MAAAPLNALSTTRIMAAGIAGAFITRIMNVAVIYNAAINGTNLPATLAMRLMPPRRTPPTSTAITIPLMTVGTLKFVSNT